MKHIRKILLLSLFAVLVLVPSKAFALTRVSNLTELQSALAGDDDEIVVTQAIDITENTTIDGHDKKIRAEVTGLNMQGLINENSSKYNIFTISSPNITFKIDSAIIYGGSKSIIYTNQRGVNINVSDVFFGFSGSIDNANTVLDITADDKVILDRCIMAYNVASHDSIIYIPRGSSVLMNEVSIYNNRSFGTTNTGGATIENRGELYINNSTIANNYGTHLGGGIFSDGGGIDGGKVYIVNSIVNDNYSLDNNVFTNSDLIAKYYSAEDDILSLQSSNIGYYQKGTQNDYGVFTSTNTIIGLNQQNFHYKDSSLVLVNGDLSTTTYKKPIGVISNMFLNAYLNENASVATGGIYTFFDYDDSLNVKMSYGATNVASDSTALGSLSKATTLVSQYGNNKTRVAGVMGSSGVSTDTLVVVSSVKSDNGYINGVTLFGEGNIVGDVGQFEAVPDSGYHVTLIEEYLNGNWVPTADSSVFHYGFYYDRIFRVVYTKDVVDNGDSGDGDSGSGSSGSDDSGTEETTNPNTGDNIVIYGSLLVISLLVLGVCFKLKKN